MASLTKLQANTNTNLFLKSFIYLETIKKFIDNYIKKHDPKEHHIIEIHPKVYDLAVQQGFDKTAKLLGIEFPGGPQIEILAKKGDTTKYDLPKPIFNKGGCNLSFAGLKTAVLRLSKNIKTNQEKFDLAASFQKTIEDILNKKIMDVYYDFISKQKIKGGFGRTIPIL